MPTSFRVQEAKQKVPVQKREKWPYILCQSILQVSAKIPGLGITEQ